MAKAQIPFLIALEKNDNQYKAGYGQYYARAYNLDSPLNLKGLSSRLAMGQSLLTPEICQGVIDRITETMKELFEEGQSISLDGLGIFHPEVESDGAVAPSGYDINTMVKGIHIRFCPTNVKGEELTSRQYKDTLSLVVYGEKTVQKYTDAKGKKKYRGYVTPTGNSAGYTAYPIMTKIAGEATAPYLPTHTWPSAGEAIEALINLKHAGIEFSLMYGDPAKPSEATTVTSVTPTVDASSKYVTIDFPATAITGTTGKSLFVKWTYNGKEKTTTLVKTLTLSA